MTNAAQRLLANPGVEESLEFIPGYVRHELKGKRGKVIVDTRKAGFLPKYIGFLDKEGIRVESVNALSRNEIIVEFTVR